MTLSRTYQPDLTQAAFDEAYERSHADARLLVIYEAGRIARFVSAVLRAEGYGLFSLGKGAHRRRLFHDAVAQLGDAVPRLGPFDIRMEMGMISHVDHVEDDMRADEKAQARVEAARTQPERRLMNHRTGEVVTADAASMEILFGRSRLGDYEEVS